MDTAKLWETIQRRHDEIAQQLSDASIDQEKRPKLQKNFSVLSDLLVKHKQIVELERKVQETHAESASMSDPEMKGLFELNILSQIKRLLLE